MDQEHSIVQQVYAAKNDVQAADWLIREYLPFIKAQTAKFLQRPPIEGQDDELSIAMLAFYEAIGGYSRLRGNFLHYAAMLIRHRLIDFQRREARHRGHISLHEPQGEEGVTLEDSLADTKNHSEEFLARRATQTEIEDLTAQMWQFGVSFADVAENCPRQQRTLEACRKAMEYARETPELLEELLKTKRLPISWLSQGSGVDRKTLERHRSYLVALLLIQTNGYEIIRGHLAQVLKGGVKR